MAEKYTIAAVDSGKGGTGKTTISVNLACAAVNEGYAVTYADCDVEEPNGHLFLKPVITNERLVFVPVPSVDLDKCTGCEACGAICQFSVTCPRFLYQFHC